jgi:hypothetical protein
MRYCAAGKVAIAPTPEADQQTASGTPRRLAGNQRAISDEDRIPESDAAPNPIMSPSDR